MNPKSAYIVLIFLLAIPGKYLPAQTQNLHYNFKHLNVQTGLAQNIVYHFCQDSRGYMWLGTRNGLTLYDGTHAVNYLHNEQDGKSIPSNFITRILEDPQQQVWIGTDVGISLYNRTDNSFSNFTVMAGENKKENAFSVPLGFANDHEMWLIETKSKYIKTYDTRTHSVQNLAPTPAVDGTLWYDSVSHLRHIWTYLSSGTIHYVFNGKTLTKTETFFADADKRKGEPVLQVVHVLAQNDSTVWLSTTAGLIQLNPNNRKYILHNKWERQTVNELRFTALAPNGVLWLATGNNGVYTFGLKTKKFIDNYRTYRLDPFSICSNNIVSLYFDRFGNVWCGSYGQGASYTNVEKNYFQKMLSRNEMEKWAGNNNVQWIGSDNANNIWCMMNEVGGLWKLSADRHTLKYIEPLLDNGKKFAGRFYKLLFDDNGKAWCISQEGLFQYDIASNRLHKMKYHAFSTDLFGSYWIMDIIRLRDQSYLFSTFSGLYRITSKNGTYDIQPFSELNKKTFNSFAMLYQDQAGTIYVKDVGDHLYTLKKPTRQSSDTAIQSILFPPQVTQYYSDSTNGILYLGTNFGLYEKTGDDSKLKKVDLNPAPPFLSISSFMKTGNKLWLFGEKGIYCYDEKKNTARTFTIEDGLPANEFPPTDIIFSSGECIAGTSNGLVSFSPGRLQDNSYPPVVQLTNIYVNDVLTGFVPNPQETKKIYLQYHQNTFSFDFAPIAFQNANQCSFEYKLQGYDPEWIKSGNARYTRYSKIPPGPYLFLIRAIDANGMISPYNKTLEIEIAKPFWQTVLFRSVMLAIVLLLVWFAIKWYLQSKIRKHKMEFEKKHAVEKERTRIATDMHDDLGSGLSRIKFLSETIGIKNRRNESIDEDITKISTYSHEMIDKMGEIVWALNEKNDTLSDLLSYTRSYAVDYLLQNDINCKVNSLESIPNVFVSGEFRRNIYLTIKEALHNIVKHAKAKNVTISIKTDGNLDISIKDDGAGFENKNIRPFSNGISNMKKRMSEIKGDFNITNDAGTTITLTAPLS